MKSAAFLFACVFAAAHAQQDWESCGGLPYENQQCDRWMPSIVAEAEEVSPCLSELITASKGLNATASKIDLLLSMRTLAEGIPSCTTAAKIDAADFSKLEEHIQQLSNGEALAFAQSITEQVVGPEDAKPVLCFFCMVTNVYRVVFKYNIEAQRLACTECSCSGLDEDACFFNQVRAALAVYYVYLETMAVEVACTCEGQCGMEGLPCPLVV